MALYETYEDSVEERVNSVVIAADEIRAAVDNPFEGALLVHCAAGASRSATVVTAFIMRNRDLGVNLCAHGDQWCTRTLGPTRTQGFEHSGCFNSG